MATWKSVYTLLDIFGTKAHMVLHLNANDSATAIGLFQGIANNGTGIPSVTDMGLLSADLVVPFAVTPTTPQPKDGTHQYASAEYKMVTSTKTNLAGKQVRISVPGPKEAIVTEVKNEPLNATGATWTAFTTFLQAQAVCDSNGNTIDATSTSTGFLRRAKRK